MTGDAVVKSNNVGSLHMVDLDELQDLSDIQLQGIFGGEIKDEVFPKAEPQKMGFLLQSITTCISSIGEALKTST